MESKNEFQRKRIVVVDDDSFVHTVWRINARKATDYEFIHFTSPNLFITSLAGFSDECDFYLDCDFTLVPQSEGGGREIGPRLARLVRDRFPHAHIQLTTGHADTPEMFEVELNSGVLNAVSGKFPYPIFQDGDHPAVLPKRPESNSNSASFAHKEVGYQPQVCAPVPQSPSDEETSSWFVRVAALFGFAITAKRSSSESNSRISPTLSGVRVTGQLLNTN